VSKKAEKTEDLEYIIEPLRPLAVPIDTLVEDPANVNRHDERSIRAIMGSLARYGQRTPLVVNRDANVVEKGNGTLEAARRLGWAQIAVVFVEDDPVTHAGYSIADNRTAQLAEIDEVALSRMLEQIQLEDPEEPVSDMWTEIEWDKVLESIREAYAVLFTVIITPTCLPSSWHPVIVYPHRDTLARRRRRWEMASFRIISR
jgi:hypothetical protein